MSGESGITDYEIESDTFPADLLTRDRWFVWKYDNGRKIPRAPWVDGLAWQSWKEERIWSDFKTADEWVQKVHDLNHASCIPPKESNTTERIVFFDFDNCRDPDTGAIHPHAWNMIVGDEREAMHGALSTSGTGVHGYCWASVPEGFTISFETELDGWEHSDTFDEPPSMEVYAGDRFLGLTGQHICCTPVGLPELNDMVHRLFGRYGSERVTGTEREPDVSRDELAQMDTTTDVEDIYDAIAQTRPSDIRLHSTVTEERHDSKSLDPSWEQSESGTRIAQFDDHWLYRKGDHRLDALQIVALEERIIPTPDEYPSGDDFVDAVEELRNRGANIPELINPSDDAGEYERPSKDDGGEETGGEGAEPEHTDVEDNTTTDEAASDGGESDQWERVYGMYASAEDADDRLPARFEATSLLNERESWRCIEENDSLWHYDSDDGLYRQNGVSVIRELLVDGLREQYRAHEANEIGEQIRGRNTITENTMGGPEGLILTQNRVLKLGADEIEQREFDPEYNFVGRVETEYDPNAECPRWRAFLNEGVNTDAERKTLQEFVGYTLMHWDLPHHKALFLVGPTASGKSTFLDTVRAMLGDDSTSSLTPQQMTSERFGGAELYGTWANIRNDIPTTLIQETGQFKEITAGDPIKAEEKHQDPFMFNPTAKHMFSANQLPSANTDDEAFFRRILLIAFPDTVPRGERDPRLSDKLEDELPGILNWALKGLQRLLMQGQFTFDRSPGDTQDTWEKWGNSVKRFKKVCLEESAGNHIPKANVFQAFLEFCEDEGIPRETQHKMTRQLKSLGVEDGREYINGSQERVFKEIAFTSRGAEYRNDGSSSSSGSGIDDY